MNIEQRKLVRKELKKAGYDCQIHQHKSPFSDGKEITIVSLIIDGHAYPIQNGNVFTCEFYEKHKVAFEIIQRRKA